MAYVLDTSFVIDLMRSDGDAVRKAKELDDRRAMKLLPAPTIYEIVAGLLFSRSKSEAAAFQRLAEGFQIAQFDEQAALKAAEIRAELLKTGRVKSHVDTMIAGIAFAAGNILISRDGDFRAIRDVLGLQLETY